MAKGDSYYETSYADPFPNLFEEYSDGGGFQVAEPLARCDMPRHAPYEPSGHRPCEQPAIAQLDMSGDSKPMALCNEHLEEVREGSKRRDRCDCVFKPPDLEEGEHRWTRVPGEECDIEHDDHDTIVAGGE